MPTYALAFALIENHYFRNGSGNIPGIIVQGRYDVCTPVATEWDDHTRHALCG